MFLSVFEFDCAREHSPSAECISCANRNDFGRLRVPDSPFWRPIVFSFTEIAKVREVFCRFCVRGGVPPRFLVETVR